MSLRKLLRKSRRLEKEPPLGPPAEMTLWDVLASEKSRDISLTLFKYASPGSVVAKKGNEYKTLIFSLR
jgi:hypothetical protein